MANKMPFEPKHPNVLQPWGCLCSIVIEGDFVLKGAESQDSGLEYKKYLMLLFRE